MVTIFKLQKKIIRAIYGINRRESCKQLFIYNSILTVPCMFIYECLKFVHRNYGNLQHLSSYHQYKTRNSYDLCYPIHDNKLYETSPTYSAIKIFNNLPKNLKENVKKKFFLNDVKAFLLSAAYYSVSECLQSS